MLLRPHCQWGRSSMFYVGFLAGGSAVEEGGAAQDVDALGEGEELLACGVTEHEDAGRGVDIRPGPFLLQAFHSGAVSR